MLHCCGGTGFKKEPLQLERYLRDGKAGWVMGPTNEVLRQFVGKTALLGIESLDYWNQVVNTRAMENELKKLSPDQKRELANAADERGRRVGPGAGAWLGAAVPGSVSANPRDVTGVLHWRSQAPLLRSGRQAPEC